MHNKSFCRVAGGRKAGVSKMSWSHLSVLLYQVEQEEEYITNTLMKRLKQAKDEKQKIAIEVENEEEYLVNNLQKRLQTLYSEKLDLEMQLQIEQDTETKLKQSVSFGIGTHNFP